NQGDGISIQSSANNVIGGTLPGAGNVISANGGNGVSIVDNPGLVQLGHHADGNVIQGNNIGTDVMGTLGLGNAGDGVTIVTASYFDNNEIVGGTDPGAGNVIAFNGGHGISALSSSGNVFRGNDIFANAGPGIVADINGDLSADAEPRSSNLIPNPLVL